MKKETIEAENKILERINLLKTVRNSLKKRNMIFYTDSMQRNYVNSIPKGEFFYVASYGYKKGLYNIPDNALLMIAEPYMPDCKPNCPECKLRRENAHRELLLALQGTNYKLVDKHHLKLIITPTLAIIGSRNLTGSQFEDLSIGIEDPKMIKALKEHFEYLWNKCGNSSNNELLNLPQTQELKGKYLFDVEREDLYEYNKPKERTRKRLIEMAECGMEETGIASFGYEGVMGGLYLEKVWEFSDEKFKDYMDWAKGLIAKHLSNLDQIGIKGKYPSNVIIPQTQEIIIEFNP